MYKNGPMWKTKKNFKQKANIGKNGNTRKYVGRRKQ